MYFTAADCNKFTNETSDGKIKQKQLANESNISNLARNSELNTKLRTLAAKAELKAQHDRIVKLEAFDLSYFYGKKLFWELMVFKICLFINQHLIPQS